VSIALIQDRVAHKVSGANRRKKYDFFINTFQPTPDTKILDVGPSEGEYSPSDNLIEKLYPYPGSITALGIEAFDEFIKRYPSVTLQNYDGKHFPFEDKSFDICWSNAVIEHVGDDDRQVLFLKEINRVAKSAFLTTPNRLFPVEVHTRTPLLHFLPKQVFDRYLHLVGKSWAADDYMFLLSLKDIQRLLQQAGIENYIIKKNRFMGFVMDFVIMFGDHIAEQSEAMNEPMAAVR